MWRLKSSANWRRLPRGFSVVKVSRIRLERRDWPGIIDELVAAGFGVPELADRILSTPPSVRNMRRGATEPKHSQGVYLMSMLRAVKAGTLKPKDKNNE